ncbi:hypothetical protein HHI36_020116, partial [Cryptolaemus montrouzieri]
MAELKLKRETEAKRRQAITRSLYINDDLNEDDLDQEGKKDNSIVPIYTATLFTHVQNLVRGGCGACDV